MPSEKAGRDLVAAGTLTHEVVREFESGYLSFHYRVNGGPVTADNMDFEGLSMRGFGTWFTDLRSDRTHESHSISRYADGDGLSYWDQHCDHWIIVRTDAPDFAEGGSFGYRVDWDGWGEDGFARVDTFRPVPEPGAGLLALTGGAAMLIRRRRRPASVPPPAAGR